MLFLHSHFAIRQHSQQGTITENKDSELSPHTYIAGQYHSHYKTKTKYVKKKVKVRNKKGKVVRTKKGKVKYKKKKVKIKYKKFYRDNHIYKIDL